MVFGLGETHSNPNRVLTNQAMGCLGGPGTPRDTPLATGLNNVYISTELSTYET